MSVTMAFPTTTFADHKDTYEKALNSLFSGKPENTETDLAKLFTSDFFLEADDDKFDFDAFVKHIRHLREILPKVKVETVQFLRDGAQLAERHLGTTTLSDGKVLKSETYQFAEVAADGRVAWIKEIVRPFGDA